MKNNKPIISSVIDNKDKQNTYSVLMGRYHAAIKHEFFFEAMLIVYAMMEDRLRSMLYYLGVCNSRVSNKLDVGTTKSILKCIYFGSLENAVNKSIKLSNISTKLNMIERMLKWVEIQEEIPTDKYLRVLKNDCESCLDIDGICTTFEDIRKWCRYRNEVIHASLNKNVNSLYQELNLEVKKGMIYARYLDSQVKQLKRNGKTRKVMKLTD